MHTLYCVIHMCIHCTHTVHGVLYQYNRLIYLGVYCSMQFACLLHDNIIVKVLFVLTCYYYVCMVYTLQQYPQPRAAMVKHWALYAMPAGQRRSSTDQLWMRYMYMYIHSTYTQGFSALSYPKVVCPAAVKKKKKKRLPFLFYGIPFKWCSSLQLIPIAFEQRERNMHSEVSQL